MARSTRRRRSHGGVSYEGYGPYTALMNFLEAHKEYKEKRDMDENPGDVKVLTEKTVLDMIRKCKFESLEDAKSYVIKPPFTLPNDYDKKIINFIQNVCLAMKIDYKQKCKDENVNPEIHREYQAISNKYRDIFGNDKNTFSFFRRKKNPTLEDAVNAWSSIHFFWNEPVTPSNRRRGGFTRKSNIGGSRHRKTRKH
jgi:hypothetical protein